MSSHSFKWSRRPAKPLRGSGFRGAASKGWIAALASIWLISIVPQAQAVRLCTQIDGFEQTCRDGFDFGSFFDFDYRYVSNQFGGGGWAVRAALSPDEAEEGFPDCSTTQVPVTGQPVVITTGNKLLSQPDFAVDAQMGLRLTRTYNRAASNPGLFGPHWPSTFDFKLAFTYADGPTSKECVRTPGSSACFPTNVTQIKVMRGDGAGYTFVRDGNNYRFVDTRPQPLASIEQQGDQWVLKTDERTVETYSSSGEALSVRDESGVGWSFEYSGQSHLTRVVHSSGQAVRFTWTGDRVTAVTAPTGAVYRYTYTAGQLTGMT